VASLARRVARLQVGIVRELNNIHIFLEQAIPLLRAARDVHATSTHKKDRRYTVPSVRRAKFARRKDREIKQIYDYFTSNRLYESFLLTAIAEFESFLGRVLREILCEYPIKLSTSVQGIPPYKQVPLETLLTAATVDGAVRAAITEHLGNVFFAQPKAYLEYVSKVAGLKADDPSFDSYVEIKATRDLVIHNHGIVNAVYLQKAGKKARGALGQAISVDSAYFDGAIATLKRVSGIIKRDVEKTFPEGA
jgi:hypothetical protein